MFVGVNVESVFPGSAGLAEESFATPFSYGIPLWKPVNNMPATYLLPSALFTPVKGIPFLNSLPSSDVTIELYEDVIALAVDNCAAVIASSELPTAGVVFNPILITE